MQWEKLPPDGASISPASLAHYDALFIGGAKVNERALVEDMGRLRVLARNDVGFDALDIPALSRARHVGHQHAGRGPAFGCNDSTDIHTGAQFPLAAEITHAA